MNDLRNLLLWIWVVFWLYWLISSFSAKKNITSRLYGFAGLRLVIFVVVIMIVHLYSKQAYTFGSRPTANGSKAAVIIGFIIFLLGLLLAIWARLHLGRNWGMPMTRKQEPQLVTSGPYRFIRHPIYSGVLLAILGSALAISLYWLIPLVITGAYFIYSATVEEKNMTNEFPKVYPEYKHRTKMLLPFIL